MTILSWVNICIIVFTLYFPLLGGKNITVMSIIQKDMIFKTLLTYNMESCNKIDLDQIWLH